MKSNFLTLLNKWLVGSCKISFCFAGVCVCQVKALKEVIKVGSELEILTKEDHGKPKILSEEESKNEQEQFF